MPAARAGKDFPASYAEFLAWFGQDWQCADYLDWLRWPDGFVCPKCATARGWRGPDGRWRCAGCAGRFSATAGTIFHRTRTPLTVWFDTAWRLCSSRTGVSAVEIQEQMQLGSYQTAWTMLHRYRSVMVRPGRERLTGDVEVDEAFLGGPQPGVRGRGALGKTLIAGAVEREGDGFVRARLAVIDSADTGALRRFLTDHVAPGATVHTDGWSSYPPATRGLYHHEPISVSASGLQAHEVLPAVHAVFGMAKRWLMGTHHGAVRPAHVQAYLDEWVFRFNRRNSRSRGLLFYRLLSQAVAGEPVRYADLRKAGMTRPAPPPPGQERGRPPRLALGPTGLPWRE